MAVVSIIEGATEHRFPDVPEGYQARVVDGVGVLELVKPSGRLQKISPAMGVDALVLATELDSQDN